MTQKQASPTTASAASNPDVHPLIRERRSPRAFAPTPLDDGALGALLEAARWAPSCFNEQPWRFVVARKDDTADFERLLSCLGEKNQVWAKDAAALMLTVAKRHFDHNGHENAYARHDVGLAVAQLTLEATARGVGVHQMAGFSAEIARERCGIPEAFEPVTVLALGYPGDPEQLPEELRDRELAPRQRLAQREIAFAGVWGVER